MPFGNTYPIQAGRIKLPYFFDGQGSFDFSD